MIGGAAKIIHNLPKNIMACSLANADLHIEMFKAKHMLNNRLSQHVKISHSKRNGKLMEIPGKNLELVLKGLSEGTKQLTLLA